MFSRRKVQLNLGPGLVKTSSLLNLNHSGVVYIILNIFHLVAEYEEIAVGSSCNEGYNYFSETASAQACKEGCPHSPLFIWSSNNKYCYCMDESQLTADGNGCKSKYGNEKYNTYRKHPCFLHYSLLIFNVFPS